MSTISVASVRPTRKEFESLNATIATSLIVAVSFFLPANPVSQVCGAIGLLVLTGAWIASLLSLRSATLVQRIVIVLALGALTVMLGGATYAAIFHAVGIAGPLSRGISTAVWLAVVASAAIWSGRTGNDPVRHLLVGLRSSHVGWAALLSLPPIAALVGTVRLNVSGRADLAIAVAISVVVLTTLAVSLPSRIGPPKVMLLASAMLTATWQNPMRGGWMAGFDIQHEYYIGSLAIHQGRFPLAHFVDPYGGMTSLTVWPALLHSLFGVGLHSVLVIAPSMFLSGCVVAIWSVARDRLTPRVAALLCALFVLGSEPLLQELPQVTRQCYALFFFSVLVMAVGTSRLSVASARVIAAASGVGVAVTHYSTAYLTSGAVIVGCLLTYAYRAPRAQRVLTVWVSAIIVGAALAWGAIVAKTGSNISQVLASIRTDGLKLLPGSGGIVSKWLSAASVSKIVNARVLQASDLHLRLTRYRWMHVLPQWRNVKIVNVVAPTAHGAPFVGAGLSLLGALLAQGILLVAIVSVVTCLVRARRDRGISGVTGIAVFFLLAAGLSRFSQTIGVEFDPARVQAQAYLVFAATTSVALVAWRVPDRMRAWGLHHQRRSTTIVVVAAVGAAIALLASTELSNFAEKKASLPTNLSASGEGAQRLPVPADVTAAGWLAAHRPSPGFVQSDRFGQLPLYVYGFIDRLDFFGSVNPVITDNGSWILATRTNVVMGIARGGDNAQVGVFRFPSAYYSGTRPILYVSRTNVVYGSVPGPTRIHRGAATTRP